MTKAKKTLKLTLEEYGYKLSDLIYPSNGLEGAIIDAMERHAEFYHESKVKKTAEKNAASIPDFVSEITCRMVVELWNTPNVNNSNPRIKALKLIKSDANENGFDINLKKMNEIKDLILEKY
jgi:hypothetical protein